MTEKIDNEPWWKPDIFDYLSYREFMKDFYTKAKEHTRGMSFRKLSKQSGFSSPNFYKLVMENQRNLSVEAAERVAAALKLKPDEASFFMALVDFDQAENRTKKNESFERISASRHFRKAGRIEPDFFEYLSHWYYPTIREMTARADFHLDATWIAQELSPPIPVEDVERALEVLLRLGYIVEEEEGVRRGDASLTTGHEVNSLAIVNYHHQMIERGAESIERIPREYRDISALTMCVRPEQVPELKRRVHAFRETLMALTDPIEDPTTVYQLNIQLFPLNRIDELKNTPKE